MNGNLRMLELKSDMAGLIAGGTPELEAYCMALGSFIADVSSWYGVDPGATFDTFLAMVDQRDAGDQIITWLRSQMIEPLI